MKSLIAKETIYTNTKKMNEIKKIACHKVLLTAL